MKVPPGRIQYEYPRKYVRATEETAESEVRVKLSSGDAAGMGNNPIRGKKEKQGMFFALGLSQPGGRIAAAVVKVERKNCTRHLIDRTFSCFSQNFTIMKFRHWAGQCLSVGIIHNEGCSREWFPHVVFLRLIDTEDDLIMLDVPTSSEAVL